MIDRRRSEPPDAVRELVLEAHAQSKLLSDLAIIHALKICRTHLPELQSKVAELTTLSPSLLSPNSPDEWRTYFVDYCQRCVLFLDTLRLRGNSYIEREQEGFSPVLIFDYELVIDGRRLPRPVNYSLVRIQPPPGFPPQREDGRPFVVIDPRAGHGSGIGGFKADSEVGVALKDGHPVYFMIFYTYPEPEQTLADVCAAEARFLEEIRTRHPRAPAPLVIGNCQGGWAAMILGAAHPSLVGPIVIAGAPISYWAGEIGKNPFRYLAGISGGAVPAIFASDLGAGKFDGAGLVANFEQLNPANTWFRKYYDVFADVDERAEEFLQFERWWSGFYFMNENEIRWMLENLFIGNRLTRGGAVLPDGTPIDLTRIKTPIVVFASHGDNITPPQQALNWIPDLYESVDEIKARGHVIIYTLHDSVGHLGIFVSAKVAIKQHREIASVVKTIESLAPGLYEMLIDESKGQYEVWFEGRTIEDILLHDDGREEELEFIAVAKLSEWSTKTYELTLRPLIRGVVTPELAKQISSHHPIRQRRYAFSDRNPLMAGVARMAQTVRGERAPVSPDNPFLKLERLQAEFVEQGWNFLRDTRDAMIEFTFHAVYASPWMKSVGKYDYRRSVSHDVLQFPEVKNAIASVNKGGFTEGIVRILLLLAHARGVVRRDRLERADELLHNRGPFATMLPERRVRMIYEQDLIVHFVPDEALFGLRSLLFDDVDRIHALNMAMEIAGPVEEMDEETYSMFERIQKVLVAYARGWRDR